jgi:hypothetical protein
MKGQTVKWLYSVIFITSIMLASGAKAQVSGQGQGPGEGQVTDQQQTPNQQQAPVKEERSKPKEFLKVFCAERSVAQVNMLVGTINCNELCDSVYQEYPCELQQRLSEGWKVTSVSVGSVVANRDPCECRVTGTESVLERQ